jgi:hypothetical protein
VGLERNTASSPLQAGELEISLRTRARRMSGFSDGRPDRALILRRAWRKRWILECFRTTSRQPQLEIKTILPRFPLSVFPRIHHIPPVSRYHYFRRPCYSKRKSRCLSHAGALAKYVIVSLGGSRAYITRSVSLEHVHHFRAHI